VNRREQQRAAQRTYYASHRKQVDARLRVWRANNKGKIAARDQRARLKKFGLTIETWEQLIVDQHGLCLICGDPLDLSKKTHVDHNHVIKVVRGILCESCNHGLGKFRDSPTLLDRAAEYLRLRGSACR